MRIKGEKTLTFRYQDIKTKKCHKEYCFKLYHDKNRDVMDTDQCPHLAGYHDEDRKTEDIWEGIIECSKPNSVKFIMEKE